MRRPFRKLVFIPPAARRTFVYLFGLLAGRDPHHLDGVADHGSGVLLASGSWIGLGVTKRTAGGSGGRLGLLFARSCTNLSA